MSIFNLIRFELAICLGKSALFFSQIFRRGGGTAVSGLVATFIQPNIHQQISKILSRKIIFVTGTNGKTGTSSLISQILRSKVDFVLSNSSGSNLARGVVSAYISSLGVGGILKRRRHSLASVFEVDEAVIPSLSSRMNPKIQVFLNLSRDQLDRYGEIDSIASSWVRSLSSDYRILPDALVVNADDPKLFSLIDVGRKSSIRTITFGLDDSSVAIDNSFNGQERDHCSCGSPIRYELKYVGQSGAWSCSSCDIRRPAPDVLATKIVLESDRSYMKIELAGHSEILDLTIHQQGLYSVYNVLAAVSAAWAYGIHPADSIGVIESATGVFGRQEEFLFADAKAKIWLAKNPQGLNEVLRTLTETAESPLNLLLVLNDEIQDGKDISWIYDANFEILASRCAFLACSGSRAHNLSLRCLIAGIPVSKSDPNIMSMLNFALDRTLSTETLNIVTTYTGMIEIREELADRIGISPYWK
ncbi:MAG: MurT ligase domain-containing protein [Chloroflexota bacterium]|nr:MurT ligase domain-containing protein [Chloroflexota bacterium]